MRSTIVCVDDEYSILKSLGNQLKHSFGQHHDIELANSGEDALLLCAELTAEGREIPLIISDQRMQGMDGDALLIQLHSLYPETLKIMLTGQANADSIGNVVNAAALYRYIRKPWDETDLILTVTEALRRFQQEQKLIEHNQLLTTINTKLESSLSILLATLEATVDGILVLDHKGKIIIYNQKFINLWQLMDSNHVSHRSNILPMILQKLNKPDVHQFQMLFSQVSTEYHDFLHLKDGRIFEYYLQPQCLEGEHVGGVLSFRDVTQERQIEATIKYQALHDALTNLPNRNLFDQQLNAILKTAHDQSKSVAVMFLDLDHFKQVNDTLGHSVGDLLLQSVAQRLTDCLREEDLVARWGGDEFVLLLPYVRCQKGVEEIAARLITTLQLPFFLANHRLTITASIGIAVYPQDGLDGNTLLKNADTALYHVKQSGRNNYWQFEGDCSLFESLYSVAAPSEVHE